MQRRQREALWIGSLYPNELFQLDITIIQCYESTNLAVARSHWKGSVKRILIDDFSEKVGVGNSGREDIMGKEALREINENASSMICALVALSSNTGKYTRQRGPLLTFARTMKTDHITVSKKLKKSLLDVKVMRGAATDSDLHLEIGTFRIKLPAKRIVGESSRKSFNTIKLRDMGVREEVTVTLRNKFKVLADVDEDDQNVNRMWQSMFADTYKQVQDTGRQRERNESMRIHRRGLKPGEKQSKS